MNIGIYSLIILAKIAKNIFGIKNIIHLRIKVNKSIPVSKLSLLKYKIQSLSRFLPFKVVCLDQALAARWYLGLQGVSSVVFFGVNKDNDKLVAHAWLKVGDYIVTGEDGHKEFKVIASF